MITQRPAVERGRTRLAWLDSYHTFSFNEYFDPQQMGFRSLRVLNEDFVSPGGGFGRHGHRDMEILSYVLEGGLAHKDSSGGGGTIRPGEIQFMRAGTGVQHSEQNASRSEEVHFLQIWIVPEANGLAPTYGQSRIDTDAARKGWTVLASRQGSEGGLSVAQDVTLRLALLPAGETRRAELPPGRHAWVQLARGQLKVNGVAMAKGDGARVSDERRLELAAAEDAEVLLFDLA